MSNNTNTWVELETAEMDEVQGGGPLGQALLGALENGFAASGHGHVSLNVTGPGGRSIGIDVEGGFDATVTPG